MTATVLVVGGLGFIGSHVDKLLKQKGYDTVVLDDLSTGSRDAVPNGKVFVGDMGDVELLNKLFQEHKFSAVMHFAAHTDVGESVTDPGKYYVNNVAKTVTLLDAMVKNNVVNFIFSSSAAIFGNPESDKVRENHRCEPINPYGRTKLMVEQMLPDFQKIRYTCLRYFNAAGGDPDGELKNRKKKENNLIPLVLRSIKMGDKPITIFGTDYCTKDGTGVRDYIHVMDLAAAHIVAMERLMRGEPSACYNLGNGNGYSVREVIATAEEVTGKKVNVIEGARRPGDPAILIANSDEARNKLGWKPRYFELKDIVKHAWSAYQY